MSNCTDRPLLRRCLVLAATAMFLSGGAAAHAHSRWQPIAGVSIEVVDERGVAFEQVPVAAKRAGESRALLAARDGARYRIRVRNDLGERIGLVIAIDGRNIITGKRSELAAGESMYVLDPWQMEDYAGWRTGLDGVHEFFFTAWPESYAAAFGDASAKSVIAVAAWRERRAPVAYLDDERESRPAPMSADRAAGAARAAAPAVEQAAASSERKADKAAGTGYGEYRSDRATRVAFEPATQVGRWLLKYEWRERLCERGVLACESPNRLWGEDDGFAPPPPRALGR